MLMKQGQSPKSDSKYNFSSHKTYIHINEIAVEEYVNNFVALLICNCKY
jgi:hypothetical protein